jgi:hypothetical protein
MCLQAVSSATDLRNLPHLLFLGLQALAAFSPEAEERLSTNAKRTAYKSILLGLCFYHSLLLGRKKFGTGIGTGDQQAPRQSCVYMSCAVLSACCSMCNCVLYCLLSVGPLRWCLTAFACM